MNALKRCHNYRWPTDTIKMVLMNLFAGHEQRTALWTQKRKERVGRIERVSTAIYTTMCKIDS